MTGWPRRLSTSDPREAWPLSFAQQRLWFLDQLMPGTGVYNLPVCLRLHGRLQTPALHGALADLAMRHEALRTTFPVLDGDPVQVIAPDPAIELATTDLRDLPPARAEDALGELVGAAARRPFELAAGPLIRAQLIHSAEHEHVLLLVLHHIIGDAWSVEVLLRELAELYNARLRGVPHSLPAPPIQYADYAVWQRGQLAGAELERELAWWHGRLDGAPDRLDLPTDRPAPPTADLTGASHAFPLSEATWRRVLAVARDRRTTPFVILLAVYAALLRRITGQTDLLIGTTTAGRDRVELAGLVGFLVNTVPIRVTMAANRTAADLLDHVRRSTLDALARPELPFDLLVEASRPQRTSATNPLVQTVFSLEYLSEAEPEFAGLTARSASVPSEYTKFDLSMTVESVGQSGQRGLITYRTDLFEPATIAALAGRYLRLLDAFLSTPDSPLWSLPLLDPDELLPGGPSPAEEPSTLHRLLARAAAERPTAPAVDDGERQLTHAELHRAANRLAHHLRTLGAGPDEVVGVCLPRGTGLVTAQLAVLTADAAYLPLDPAHPAGRIATMLETAGTRFVVTTRELVRLLPPGAATVLVDELDLAGLPDIPPPSAADPDHLAYVLFTSGSTGAPKPVAVPHRAVVNHATAIRQRYGLGPTDRVLQLASVGFDVAAEELFPTLLGQGSAVVLTDPALSPAAFTRMLRAHRVTVANLPASYWRQWTREAVDRERSPAPPDLRLVVVGSEPVDPATVEYWHEHTGIPLVNAYGVTEATITATVADVDPGPVVPIGRPVAGVRTYVLDTELQPVPAGVTGELYLGGAGLARGYLGRADLTADRFVPCPERPGERLYRTGDRVRWRPEHGLEFLGRGDDQLNVRGHRVEPAEVEAALRTHPQVREAVASVRPAPDGETRLVAYVLPVDAARVDAAQLRAYLADRLPPYLVPSTVLLVKEIPYTANHKVDRATLAAREPARAGRAGPAPAGEIELRLVAVWRELLGVDEISTTDSFFDLGGHSLLMVRLRERLTQTFGRELPMVTLYGHPTIAALARCLAGQDEAPIESRGDDATRIRLRRRRERLDIPKEKPAPMSNDCIHAELERQVVLRPDAVAMTGIDKELTYRQLNERANQLARHLVGLGVGADQPVGVLLERSVDFIVAMVAVLKAGGGFLPLDVAAPPARIARLLDHANASVVVTDPRHAALLPAGPTVVDLEADAGTIAAQPAGNLDISHGPEGLAYIMYTSGSTGGPKGVMIPHRGILRLIRGADYVRLGPEESVALMSAVTFDVAQFEIWGALLTGGRLVIGPARVLSPAELGRLIRDQRVTTMWLTAGLFHLVVDESVDELRGLRQLMAGGDVLDPRRVHRAVTKLADCVLVNGYGPTENSAFTTCHRIPREVSPTDPVPIGRPAGGDVVRILDDHLQLLPIGVPGQLFAGGDGLARGYLKDPATTATRFVPDAYSDVPGARLYATGDRARFRNDGTIEFLGRIDQQVKIRGFRVEPGEIEDVLRGHPHVRDVAVVPHGDDAGSRRLVAYPVLDGTAVTVEALRGWLRERLPGHLIPDLWSPLESLPLNTSGKVDRRALPAPSVAAARSGEVATDPLQRKIAAIWVEVLNTPRVGPHDDFFALGGHSLLASKVVARLRRELGLEVPLSLVFDHPTVAELASAVR